MTIGIGERIRALRAAHKWSQQQLAWKAGLSRSVIATIENKGETNLRSDVLLKIARAFDMSAERLLGEPDIAGHRETAEELLERLRLAQPITIPVMPDFKIHFGKERGEPVDYVYLPRSLAPRNIAAYVVHGHCMTPRIENGDVVIVDSDAEVRVGRTIICLIDDEVVAGVYKEIDGEPYIVNNEEQVKITDYKACAVVIQIMKPG